MKTNENRGTCSARPFADMLQLVPAGAKLIEAAGSRSGNRTTFEAVYILNGSTVHLSLSQEGGAS
jgi:hypothetical protein